MENNKNPRTFAEIVKRKLSIIKKKKVQTPKPQKEKLTRRCGC
jgi:hypothetical protein